MAEETRILLEAHELVHGPRGAAYGHPLDDYTRTATLWSAILGVPVTAEQAILCMIAVKISRECHRPGIDNRRDLAGYAACLDLVARRRRLSRESSRPETSAPTCAPAADAHPAPNG